MLSKLTKIFDNPVDTASLLRNSDLVFGTITDENNNLVELTNSNYSKYIESQNREVRKQAFMTLYKGYESVKTLCQNFIRRS